MMLQSFPVIVTIALLVFKIKFILKMSKAKTDVNVFNNSFALCLLASGCKIYLKLLKWLFKQLIKIRIIEIIDK